MEDNIIRAIFFNSSPPLRELKVGYMDDFKEICEKSFSQKRNMNNHMTSVHEGIKAFKCDICRYGCSQKVILDKHMVSVHNEGNI